MSRGEQNITPIQPRHQPSDTALLKISDHGSDSDIHRSYMKNVGCLLLYSYLIAHINISFYSKILKFGRFILRVRSIETNKNGDKSTVKTT